MSSQCEYCPFNITCEMDMCFHLNTKHKDKVPKDWFSCSRCNWSYTSEEKLNAHKRCCAKDGLSNENTESCWIYCQYCPEVFVKSSMAVYFKHAKSYHLEEVKRDWFSCKQCSDSIYPSKTSLKKHQWYFSFVFSYFGLICYCVEEVMQIDKRPVIQVLGFYCSIQNIVIINQMVNF